MGVGVALLCCNIAVCCSVYTSMVRQHQTVLALAATSFLAQGEAVDVALMTSYE